MITVDQLRERIHRLEADNVELTESTRDTDKFCEAICAFSNDLPNRREPGILVIGLRKDRSCANINVSEALLANLASIRSDGNIQPLPRMSVRREEMDGCTIAVVEVEPSDNPPVRYKGRVCVRIGPRRGFATADEERRLTEKRRWGNLPFDQHAAPGSTIDDLNLRRFREEYLPAAVSPDVLEQNKREESDQLRALRLLSPDGVPTTLAILLLANDPRRFFPGAYIQFVRFDGNSITDPIKDQKEVSGSLSNILHQIDETMLAHISTAADSSEQRETRQPDYPIVALRELIRNAVIHRTYESSNAPVQVYWYSNRIEIISPGGPYGQVSPDTFGQPNAVDYRNPGIAEAMKNLGYAQRFGLGIPRAREELRRNGNPEPTFDPGERAVLVTVRKRE